ncbi:MAG: Lrp/AsnC family transcriptional regulator [Candidatus Thorarchaeota archaeon]
MKTKQGLDELDLKILSELQKDCRTPLQEVAKRVGAPSSTVHYRVKKLEREGIIDGYYAHINSEKLDMDYLTIIRIGAEYGPKYYDDVGKKLAETEGVWAVYFVLGETDFYVLTRSADRRSYMKILDRIMSLEHIKRTSTQVVAKVIKEDPRLQILTLQKEANEEESA